MVVSRQCNQVKSDGSACRAAPLVGEPFCRLHHPEHQLEAAASRKRGGIRRRRASALSPAAESFNELRSIADIRRLIAVAVEVTLKQESSIAQARTLAYLAQTATKLLEVAEFDERVRALEAVVQAR
jgi:hypothetical protein